MKWRWLASLVPPLLVFVVLCAAAESYIRWQKVPQYMAAPPSAVFRVMQSDAGSLMHSLFQTASAALIGFGLSGAVGVLLAIFLSSSRWIQRAFYPYTLFFQTVPIIAIAPMLVLWLEAGLKSVAACAFIVSVFPVITNTMAGLLSTDPALRDMFTLYNAGPLAKLFKLRLPSALPNIFVGLRIAAGLAVIGAIVGEFVAAELSGDAGLGVTVGESIRESRIDRVFAAILIASVFGLALLTLINVTGHLLLRHWHASEQ